MLSMALPCTCEGHDQEQREGMLGAPLRATVTNNDQTLIEKDECEIIMPNMLSSCAFSHLRSQIKKLVVAFAWWIVVKEVKNSLHLL